MGHLKHVITQNTDGLHRLSGIPREKLSELHGNSFHEKCEKCGARFERPFAVRRCVGGDAPPRICVHCNFDHRTGRMCERKVSLHENIVHTDKTYHSFMVLSLFRKLELLGMVEYSIQHSEFGNSK